MPSNHTIRRLPLSMMLFTALGFIVATSISNAEEPDLEKAQSVFDLKMESDYSDSGADNCLRCHDTDSDYPATKIFFTAHGNQNDKNSPMAQFQCESCHGPAGEHSVRRVPKGEEREAMIDFTHQNMPVVEMNKICSSCHQNSDDHFSGSSHEIMNVACTDCHKVHDSEHGVLKKQNQIEICGTCHIEQKLSSNKFSSHPLDFQGQMGCVDCHSPHATDNDHQLAQESVNDTCFSCHAEKRGPFVWEHEPATDNCANCHSSHGSNHADMLVQKAPFLCQNCHSSQGHPAIAYDRPGINNRSESMLLGRSCMNCHGQIHGSNHPSGSTLQR